MLGKTERPITTTRHVGYQRTDEETMEAKVKWIAAFIETGVVHEAAAAANVNRGQHLIWAENDADFRKTYDYAKAEANDRVRAEIRRRAMDGDQRTKTLYRRVKILDEQGNESYQLTADKREVIEERSDILLIFLAKSLMPAEFRDRVDIQVSWSDSTMDWLAGVLTKHIKDPKILEAISTDMLIGPPSE